MSEIELHERYPESRTEDITDAYLRGFQACTELMYNPLVKVSESQRELIIDMWYAAVTNMDYAERYAFIGEFNKRMRLLGIEF